MIEANVFDKGDKPGIESIYKAGETRIPPPSPSSPPSPPSPADDYTPARTGMWIFMVTEIFLTWGVFLIYSVYHSKYPENFYFAGSSVDLFLGFLTTMVLITGSLTIFMANIYYEQKNREYFLLFLSVTVLLGFFFLIIKIFEWSAKIRQDIFPYSNKLQSLMPGESAFYNLYLLSTGFHGLLVIAAAIALAALLVVIWQNPQHFINSDKIYAATIKIENTALIWQTLTVIWVFLFTLFYLIT